VRDASWQDGGGGPLAPPPPQGEEEEFFNHYKNNLKRHAHAPSGVAGVLVLLLGLCEPLPITHVFGSPEADTTGAGSRLSCLLSAAPVGWSSRGGVLCPQGCSPLGLIPLLGSPLATLLPSQRKPWFLPTVVGGGTPW
jgi:hypothetical protein